MPLPLLSYETNAFSETRPMEGSPGIGCVAGIPPGCKGSRLSSGGVVASLLNHRLMVVNPPGSYPIRCFSPLGDTTFSRLRPPVMVQKSIWRFERSQRTYMQSRKRSLQARQNSTDSCASGPAHWMDQPDFHRLQGFSAYPAPPLGRGIVFHVWPLMGNPR